MSYLELVAERRRWLERAAKLYEEGATLKELECRIGRTASTIGHDLRHARVQMRPREGGAAS